jgi:prepilin-type N-terminal cleavage/methylation domain-containing protein
MEALISFRKRKGFSLLEVLIAITIINVGVLASVNLMSFTLHNWKSTSSKLQNTLVVQGKMELVRNFRDNNPVNWSQVIVPPSGVTIVPGPKAGEHIVSVSEKDVNITYHLYDWR